MEPKGNAAPFAFDPGAVFSIKITTRDQTRANKKQLQKTGHGKILTELLVDMQSCVLAFLRLDKLAHYSEVNRICRAVATLDHR
jgi:hypothetical protein